MTQTADNPLTQTGADREAILHLREAVSTGKNWYVALLEAVGLWGSAEELHDGRYYRYLIGGEAFDWLSLAERLCQEINGFVPENEKLDLLFAAAPPIQLPQGQFRQLVGETKYRAYLNYLYGVVVEEALLSAVEEEVQKENGHMSFGFTHRVEEEAFRRIYDAEMTDLLAQFRGQKANPEDDSMTLTDQKEFTYWLFKHRVEHCEKARVASDTRKALVWLQRQWNSSTKRRPGQTADAYPLLGPTKE